MRFNYGPNPFPYREGQTYDLPSITGPWENTSAPMARQGAWERYYRTWPYWMNTLNGRIPAPGPMPGTDPYIKRNRPIA